MPAGGFSTPPRLVLWLVCRFLTPTLMGGVSFGAGLGITLFGIMYMFIHDGMVHRRFPVSRLGVFLPPCVITALWKEVPEVLGA